MKVLVLHNRYRHRGGEDLVVNSEEQILSIAGHTVLRYERDNLEIQAPTLLGEGSLAIDTIWSRKSHRDVFRIARKEKPDVAHFHNTLPLISPAAYWACKEAAIPVVQTLHNYRLLCPAATFLRDGKVCESCLGKRVPWPGAIHACYRNSRIASGVVSVMLTIHGALHTWTKAVDMYIALSEFSKKKFVEGGLPAAQIRVKPNFVHPDPGDDADPTDFALFVGRLSEEKGLSTLLATWRLLGNRMPLRIVGDGPLNAELEADAGRSGLSCIHFEGRLARKEVFAVMKRARFLVVPSECYENFPMAIVEAFACGVPVIAFRLGAVEELVDSGRTGLLCTSNDPEDLAEKIKWAWAHPGELREMGRAARREYEMKYTAERNYELLKHIYDQVRVTSCDVSSVT